MVAQDRSFLKPRRSGKSGTSHTVAFEHAKASAALAASFKSLLHSFQFLTLWDARMDWMQVSQAGISGERWAATAKSKRSGRQRKPITRT